MPLLAAAAWYALGIALAQRWIPVSLLASATVALTLLTVAALLYARRLSLLPLATLWITAGIIAWQWHPVPSTQHELQRFADGLSRDVQGRVVRVRPLPPPISQANTDTDKTWWEEREPATNDALSIDLAVEAIEEVTPDLSRMLPASGGVHVTLLVESEAPPELRCGDSVLLPLRLRIPHRYHDPGAWQSADYLLTQGIGTQATARPTRLKIIDHHPGSLSCILSAMQQWSAQRLRQFIVSADNQHLPASLRLNQSDAAMLNAMLFGDRTHLARQLRAGFERTGSFHLFVVSGMHVALLAGLLLALLRRLHIRSGLATIVTIPAIAGYALLTGFGAPVQRALFMTTIFLIAQLLTRERSVLNSLGAAALAELVLSPGALFEASFQMTFLAVFAIAGIAAPFGERSITPWERASRHLSEMWRDPRLPPRLAQFRVMLRNWGESLADACGGWIYRLLTFLVSSSLWIAELALIGLVAEMVMALPMALYFHRATLFALPANMLTIPIIGLVMPLAIIFFLLSLISPTLAVLPAAVVAACLHAVAFAIGFIGRHPAADLRIPGPSLVAALAVLALWIICLWAVRRSRRWAAVALVLLPLGTLIALWPQRPLLTPTQLEFTAIDVGQGDSLLLVSPQGHTMLVDAGGPVGRDEVSSLSTNFDIGEEIVSNYLWTRRIRRLDILVLSHAHSDHMGGMPAVLRNLRPRELWLSVAPDSEAYRSLIVLAREFGVNVRHLHAGDRQTWDSVQVSALAPEPVYANPAAPTNNDSLVLRLDYGRSSVLLEGDAEADSERTMLAHNLAPVSVLKVGHHGSRTSTTEPFLDTLHPRAAVISVGRGNTFGHPRPEVVERLSNNGARVYRTDEFGLTTLLLGADGSLVWEGKPLP